MNNWKGKAILALWVATIAALVWIALEVRWTRQAIPYGLDYTTEQTLRGMASDLEQIAKRLR